MTCFQIAVCLFFIGRIYNAEKIYFSKWIQTDLQYPWNIYVIETILNTGLNRCVDNCKARKKCEYINFKIRASVCYLVGSKTFEGGTSNDHADRIQTKLGFIFGKKREWILDIYQVCTLCENQGDCQQGETEDKFAKCQNSGCRPPEQKHGTVLHGNMLSAGSKMEYHCKVGYTNMANGTGITICLNDGNWSSTSIRCIPDVAVSNVFLDSYYFLDKNNWRNWQDGQAYCEDLGGHLADIKTSLEMEYVTTLFVAHTHAWSWLGANDKANEGTWNWLDGTSVNGSYNVWGPGQPPDNDGLNCMLTRLVYINGVPKRVWVAESCDYEIRSICEF